MLQPRIIDRTIVICICRRPITLQVEHGKTVRVVCTCGNVIVETFPPRRLADRKAEIIEKLNREPTSRWDAIGLEFLLDELKDLEKNTKTT